MKRIVLILLFLTIIGFVACKGEKKENHDQEYSEEMAKTEYYCPMECEGDETYTDKDAKCPVCKMDLVEKKKDSEHEEKADHDKSNEHKENDVNHEKKHNEDDNDD
ncbi:MAG: hypothetical protein KUG51_00575 [Urechidicola sp.]|nr:hypothetical protein [Urechidicola sp.]